MAVGSLSEIVTKKKSIFEDSVVEKKDIDVIENQTTFDVSKTSDKYIPKDIDMNVIPDIKTEEDSSITKLDLPDDISSYIENMAGKLNKGLGKDKE